MRSQLSFEPHPFIRPPYRSRVYICPFRGGGGGIKEKLHILKNKYAMTGLRPIHTVYIIVLDGFISNNTNFDYINFAHQYIVIFMLL